MLKLQVLCAVALQQVLCLLSGIVIAFGLLFEIIKIMFDSIRVLNYVAFMLDSFTLMYCFSCKGGETDEFISDAEF